MPETDAEKKRRETEQLAEIKRMQQKALERINTLQPANISDTVSQAKRSILIVYKNLNKGNALNPDGNERNIRNHLGKIIEKLSDCILVNLDYVHTKDITDLTSLLHDLLQLPQIKDNVNLTETIDQALKMVEEYSVHFRRPE